MGWDGLAWFYWKLPISVPPFKRISYHTIPYLSNLKNDSPNPPKKLSKKRSSELHRPELFSRPVLLLRYEADVYFPSIFSNFLSIQNTRYILSVMTLRSIHPSNPSSSSCSTASVHPNKPPSVANPTNHSPTPDAEGRKQGKKEGRGKQKVIESWN